WEDRTGRNVRLAGFSTHYNVSIEPLSHRLEPLAKLLSYILPVPVMLLATNRGSTGVGVRPRSERIEVTADFTPDATLMVAAGSLITGIVREVATWPSFALAELQRRGLPRIRGYRPMPHTSRKGWLARVDCYPANPIAGDINAPVWQISGRAGTPVSLREIGVEIFDYFARSIARVADPFSL